jgi:hypothetical protein
MTFEEWWAWSPLPQNVEQLQKLQREAWNAAIMEALRQVSLPCRSGDAGRDRLQDDLAKLLTA